MISADKIYNDFVKEFENLSMEEQEKYLKMFTTAPDEGVIRQNVSVRRALHSASAVKRPAMRKMKRVLAKSPRK